jgi:hypothetical protein
MAFLQRGVNLLDENIPLEQRHSRRIAVRSLNAFENLPIVTPVSAAHFVSPTGCQLSNVEM